MAGRGDYVSFLFKSPTNRSFGFKTYTNEMGQAVGFIEGYDKDKMPIYRRWRWDQDGGRIITVHKNKTDVSPDKRNAVDFLRNSPNCKGSPNGSYGHDGRQLDIYFEEVNEEKAAKEALSSETARIEAQNLALKVKNHDFVDLCALIGVINKDESVMRFALVDYAKHSPEKFMELYNDPVRQIKSLLTRGIAANKITKQGHMLSWGNELLGVDEDDAVNKLSKDEKLLKAITTQVEKG